MHETTLDQQNRLHLEACARGDYSGLREIRDLAPAEVDTPEFRDMLERMICAHGPRPASRPLAHTMPTEMTYMIRALGALRPSDIRLIRAFLAYSDPPPTSADIELGTEIAEAFAQRWDGVPREGA